MLRYGSKLCVPNDTRFKGNIMREAHNARYSIQPRATKMYQDLKKVYWWPSMEKEISQFMSTCEVYQGVKLEHQKSLRMLNPLPIRKWK